MFDIHRLRQAVQRNCHISDARHARNYTMCIYLLKMREYFRWEMELPQTARLDSDGLGEWVTRREQMWDELEPEEFACLPVAMECHDPFDAEVINDHLASRDLVYSAGYGRFVKPHFFLARLHERDQRDGFDIFVSGQELARDISAPPAMLLGRSIFVRRDALRRFIWERYEEWVWRRRPEGPMADAMAEYPFASDPEHALEALTSAEVETAVSHELGEGRASRAFGDRWEEMLLEVAGTRAEIHVRAVRDLYADCLVTLPSLLVSGRESSLHFYMANLNGMRRALFPALQEGYRRWMAGDDADRLRQIGEQGRDHWRGVGMEILGLADSGRPDMADAIANHVGTRAFS